MFRLSLGPNYSLYVFRSIKPVFACFLFLTLYSFESWFRGSGKESIYFCIFKEFPLGRKAVLLTEHASLEGREASGPSACSTD